MNLPWDVILDILILLPLKSLVQFRCVNQSWNNKLKCPKFLKARSDYAVEMGKFNLMFHDHNDIYTFSYDASLSTCEVYNHIEYPVESTKFGIRVLGSCNGLVLLKHVSKINFYVLILWNPTTDECKRIPNPRTGTKEAKNRSYEEYGFGYDEKIEDFKVVNLAECLQDGWCEVQVYTLKPNSWRRIDNVEVDNLFPRSYDMGLSPVAGCFHWMAEQYHSNFADGFFLLRFEFETNEFVGVPLLDEDEPLPKSLCVLGGSLCCICYQSKVLSMWEWKDNVEEERWTKLFSIELRKHFGRVSSYTPLQFLKNGKIVLGLVLSDGCLHIVLYDLEHDTFRTIHVHDRSARACADAESTSIYVESLLSLGTGTYLAKVQWEASHEDWNDSSEEDKDDDGNTGGGDAEEE